MYFAQILYMYHIGTVYKWQYVYMKYHIAACGHTGVCITGARHVIVAYAEITHTATKTHVDFLTPMYY